MPVLLYKTASYDFISSILDDLNESAAHGWGLSSEAGRLEAKQFPDGERYTRFLDEVEGRHVVIVGGTISDADTLEIYDLACAAVKYGASELTLVIPYFGYSTMERAIKTGEVVPAKTRARLFSFLPKAHKGNNIRLLDLHSLGIPHYFEGDIKAKHLNARREIINMILDAAAPWGGKHDFVLGSTDAGRAKQVESLAQDLSVDAAFCYKRRTSGSDTEIVGVNADVNGRYVVIYDDMIRTGGSINHAVNAYMNSGALKVGIVTTHGLFVGNCLEKFKKNESIDFVGCTNSHPNHLRLADLASPEIRTVVSDVFQTLLADIH